MKERLEEAKKRLAELQKIENPTDEQRGSIVFLTGVIKYLERVLEPQK
jgi:hypothetical protein